MSGHKARTFAVAAALMLAGLGLSGCVYYPSYGYGYGYPYSTAYAPPPVYGSVTIGGLFGGGDWHDHDGGHWHH